MSNREASISVFWKAVLLIVCACAILSTIRGVMNATVYSQDFMWSPTVIFMDHRNPFDIAMNGNPKGEIILAQNPNYLHSLYILLIPFGAMSWSAAKISWALVNVALAIASGIMVGRLMGGQFSERLLLLAVFLCSTAFRNGIGNGQQQELVMFLFLLSWTCQEKYLSGVALGLSFLKYSFAPPLAFAALLSKGMKPILVSALVNVAAVLVFAAVLQQDPIHVLWGPLRVADGGIAPGAGDIMSLIETLLPPKEYLVNKAIFYGLPLTVSIVVTYSLFLRCGATLEFIGYCGLVALICFKHLTYDYVFLLPLFAVGLKNRRDRSGIVILAAVAYSWFAQKMLHDLGVADQWLFAAQLASNAIALVTAWVDFGQPEIRLGGGENAAHA